MSQPDLEFLFRLAEKLGYTVQDMLSRMSSREVTQWQAYFALPQIRQRIQEQQRSDEQRSQHMLKSLFGAKHGGH